MSACANGPRLIMVCGLPGAGKTTLARKLEHQLRAVRMCPDEWMEELAIDLWDEARRAKIEAFQWKLGQKLLEVGQTIIIEWGTWARAERDQLRKTAREHGAAVELHYVSAPFEVLFERLQQRGLENPPIRLDQLQHWATLFDVPTAEEMALYDGPSKVD
ncbi:MAG TPA: ATP-binding protein [Gemmataceae bacterium]|nr:ATP-binding protein [Gemmataceae bacterium]